MWSKPPEARAVALAALLAAANAFVCWKLFFIEFTSHMGSIDGSFIAFARYAMENFRDMTWFPLWLGGMPYQNVYGPVAHHLVAALAKVTGMSPALSFHVIAAVAYCLGAATVFWMAWRISESFARGWWAGLLFSICSPSVWLIPAIRVDTGGPFRLRRLHNLVVWGEMPHVFALALAPLALVALDSALRKGGPRRYAIAALALAVLALTNVTGAVGFAMMLAAYFLATPLEQWPRAAMRTAGIGVLAYGLASPWIPPSTLLLISANSRRSAGNYYPFTSSHMIYVALIALGAAGLVVLFRRWNASRYLRFALFLTYVSGAVTLPAFLTKFAVIPQPERFHLELELGCCLAGAALLARLPRAAALALSALLLASLPYHRANAGELIQPIDIRSTVEYKEAKWFDGNMGGRRVFAPGSVAFWMNVFTGTPQVGGCCDQGTPHWQQRVAQYIIYVAENAGERDAEVSIVWLTVYGAHAIGVSGPGGQEKYKSFTNPRKFDGVLKELWREGGDVIYEVPQRSASLAHVIREPDRVTRAPKNGLDLEPMLPLAAALNDPLRPLAAMEWKSPTRARIEAPLGEGDLVYVQVTHDPGWRAFVNGAERTIAADPLNQMVIQPGCAGPCAIELIFADTLEMKLARASQLLAAFVWIAIMLLRRRRGPA